MDPHQTRLIEAATRLGITVERLDAWDMDAVRLTYDGRSELVLEGRTFSHLGAVADAVAASKRASRDLLAELGIPVPAGRVLIAGRVDRGEVAAFLTEHGTAVAKPVFGTDGLGVAMHLTSAAAVVAHIDAVGPAGAPWLLEEQADGDDLRLQWVSGVLVAACVRRPCFVVGDGERTLSALIEARNALIRSQNPDNHIAVDAQVERRMHEAGVALDTVLAPGRELRLKDVSNMAQGGHAIDVTDRVHPRYADYLHRIADALGLRVFSLDVMTPDPAADPDATARILEINARPAWLHHTFSDRRQHDIPTLLLRDLFGLS